MIPVGPVGVIMGDGPVVLGMPHVGTHIPAPIWERLTDVGHVRADTDWHVDRLYDRLLPEATVVRATFHRFVIDPNRAPEGGSLYPGRATTDLVPATDFDGRPLWRPGGAPTPRDVARRVAAFHAPYHAALTRELERVRDRHGAAILFDCHSIRSVIPRLFEGRLPDLNVGDDGGVTCAPAISACVTTALKERAGRFTWVHNGHFRGGWSVRHHGRPAEGIHAIQMEMAQALYLTAEAPPFDYDESRATVIRPLLGEILRRLERLVLDGGL
ncbi:N-formylglutamate deformylase [Roseospira visakhapatnamensis]|uniref:Formiminoglutamase n=1 Tax=Roseospira visakhapatnamensis TaxID=390880 RepID=A0A7W6RC18_9PROT|nr:N-formylglutamate deformylase [Roseospira visakhapatnamensis]MBB4265366.1 formiminoglutamase [Roseospira visakhapatnamensis]